MKNEYRRGACKIRGTPVYIYDAETLCLLYIAGSKQHIGVAPVQYYKNTSRNFGWAFVLRQFIYKLLFLSLDLLETVNTKLLTLNELKVLVVDKRNIHKSKHPASRAILAEFKDDGTAPVKSKNLEFDSLNSLAKHLKGDWQVIRDYLKGNKSGYYRGNWKFTMPPRHYQ